MDLVDSPNLATAAASSFRSAAESATVASTHLARLPVSPGARSDLAVAASPLSTAAANASATALGAGGATGAVVVGPGAGGGVAGGVTAGLGSSAITGRIRNVI